MSQPAESMSPDGVASPQDPQSPAHPAADSQRTIDTKIVAVLAGGTLLIAAVVARGVFETQFHSDLLAAVASVLLGVPIIYDAAMGLIGKHTHDHSHHGDETQHHDSHMEELVALAIMASFASHHYIECGAVAFFMLISSFIEHRTAVGARKTIESLMRITPTRAHRLTDGQEEEIDAALLQPGDIVIVRPGDNIPGDGIIRSGSSIIDQANITGESVPVEKTVDEEVFSGTINETSVLQIQITRAGQDSTLGRVQKLILQAASTRPAVVRMLDRYAGYYTPTVVMITAIVYFFTQDISRCITLLLIACPCAIILAAPTAMVAALSAASRLGVYVKNVTDLEVARRISAIIFDKTGTLTVGKLEVARLQPAEGVDGGDLLRICASAESDSKHPVARAVVAMAQKAKLELAPTSDFQEIAGRGVQARINGQAVLVGREAWLGEQGVDVSALDTSSAEGMSLLFVAQGGKVLGWVGMEDKVRPGAAQAMDDLDRLGVRRRVMITGDRWSPARRVAAELHVTDLDAEALPGDKLALVKSLKSKGHTVAVIGDGVNDGPALAAGDVSIAMGAAGSDVAINSASIALMNNNLNRIPFLLGLSRSTVRIIRQNLIGTLIYIIAMLVLLSFNWISPMIAAIAHGVSSIIVVFNSARLVREGELLIDHVPVTPTQEKDDARSAQLEAVPPIAPVAG